MVELLKEKSMEWKNILMHNCITLTKVYEREGHLLEQLKRRLELVTQQRDNVSWLHA